MLPRLQADYQRLEQSLQRLTDSIAAYNPSPAAAEELVAAEKAITIDLDILSRHQSNHARLQQLQQTASSLDSTLKSTIQLLADTRREIKAIPVYHENQEKPLDVDRLLAYAKFISKTSIPPTRQALSIEPLMKDEHETKPTITNGTTPTTNGDAGKDQDSIGIKSLDEQVRRTLDPLKEMPFEPWPPYAVIQQGALADIQRMIDAGKDPASVLSVAEQAEADRLKAEEDERERQEEEERQRRRMSMYAGGSRAPQDDVFDPDA